MKHDLARKYSPYTARRDVAVERCNLRCDVSHVPSTLQKVLTQNREDCLEQLVFLERTLSSVEYLTVKGAAIAYQYSGSPSLLHGSIVPETPCENV